MRRRLLVITAIAAAVALYATDAMAEHPFVGQYICTVMQKAGIGGTHLEGAPTPSAFLADAGNRFRIGVIAERDGFTIRELPYNGADRDRAEWHTPNSVLHSDYYGDAGEDDTISALVDQGFLRFDSADRATGALWFYHAGFEYPGGEDTNLSVRFGRCERERSPTP
jgi:hypothetical protein